MVKKPVAGRCGTELLNWRSFPEAFAIGSFLGVRRAPRKNRPDCVADPDSPADMVEGDPSVKDEACRIPGETSGGSAHTNLAIHRGVVRYAPDPRVSLMFQLRMKTPAEANSNLRSGT